MCSKGGFMSNVSNSTTLSIGSRALEFEAGNIALKSERKAVEVVDSDNRQSKPRIKINSEQSLEQALDVINRAMVIEQRSLNFSVDEISGRSIIKVVDRETDQLIRQIPTEEVLRVAQDIKKLQEEMGQSLGLLIDRKV